MTASDKEMRDPRRDEVIAGEYVLGVLSAEDRRKVEARLGRDTQFAAAVRRWEENLATFNDDYEALQPPPRTFSAVEQRLLGTAPRDAVLTGKVSGGFWNSLVLWRSLAVASLVVTVGIAATMSSHLAPRPVSGGRLVADLSGEGSTAMNLFARYDEARGALHITPVSASNAKSLELWLVEDGKAPASLGVLPQSGEGDIIIPADMRGRVVQGATFAVSLEPYGGSPTGAVTGPVIASGAARFD